MFYEPDRGEITTIATGDGMGCKGYGEKMVDALIAKFPSLRLQPVTLVAKLLATKCDFVPSEGDESVWFRKANIAVVAGKDHVL